MLRLETVEDFERISGALNNPNSKLSEYCIVQYGYCGYCEILSTFEHFKDPTHIRCCGCGNSFYPDYLGLSFLLYIGEEGAQRIYKFTLNTTLEPRSRPEKEFFSRKHQRKLFNAELQVKIVALKGERRVLASKIRRLAKLRS